MILFPVIALILSSLPQFGAQRIVGGMATTIKEVPFIVSLQVDSVHICGGSIIAPRFVLTAAHCVNYNGIINRSSVLAGITDLRKSKEGVVIRIKDIKIHPKYDPNNANMDFAVVELDKDLPFSESIRPIDLPLKNATLAVRTLMTVAGWGDTLSVYQDSSRLRKVFVPVVDIKACRRMLLRWGTVTDQMICAGYPIGEKDSCQGDSGGPFFRANTLHGVVSWGKGCAEPNSPGVYAKITAALDWIHEIVRV